MSSGQLRYLAATNALFIAVYAAGTGLSDEANPTFAIAVIIAMIAQIVYLFTPRRKKNPQSSGAERR